MITCLFIIQKKNEMKMKRKSKKKKSNQEK